MRHVFERKTLTPLAWEDYDETGKPLTICRFKESVPVPGAEMRIPTLAETVFHHNERGLSWVVRNRSRLEKLRLNNDVEKVYNVVPKGAVLVERQEDK